MSMTADAAEPGYLHTWRQEFFSQPRARALLGALLLAAAVLALYNPVVHFQFLNYDDDVYVTDNARVQSGLHWSNVRWALTTFDAANWHPLTWLSHMLDCRLFGLNPAGHHYVNVLLHALNAVLIFLVLYRLTGRLGRSLLVAALFGVHPLNVGSVAWVAERKNMLCTVFWWLAIAAYAWYVRQPSKQRYGAVFLMFALGLMAKPMVITLPLVLLLLDYWPLQRFGDWKGLRPLIVEKVPLFMLSAGSAAITIIAQKSGGAVRSVVNFPVSARLGNAVISYCKYIQKAVWPTRLAIFYPNNSGSLPPWDQSFASAWLPLWQVVLCLLLLILVTILCVRARRNQPYLISGWLWYLVTLLPVIGILQVGDQAMADRYAYIPLVGLTFAATWMAADVFSAWNIQRTSVPTAAALVIFAAMAMDTRHQLWFWRDSVSVFSHAIDVTERNYLAHANLAEALNAAGEYDAALVQLHALLALSPNDPIAHYDIGAELQHRKDFSGAEKEYDFVIRTPQVQQDKSFSRLLGRTYNNLASCQLALGKSHDAKLSLQRALEADSSAFRPHIRLAEILMAEGDLPGAISELRQSIAVYPTDTAYFELGKAYQQQNKPDDALEAFRHVLLLSPNNSLAQEEISNLTNAGSKTAPMPK